MLDVLLLEDDDLDAELIRTRLEDGGLACALRRVGTRQAFEAALGSTPLDLILADYAVPGFDGFEALRLARAARPEVPFVVVSGTLGEERAVDTLKLGATDYVLTRTSSVGRSPACRRRCGRGPRSRSTRAAARSRRIA
jgi:CheY-like chemotaxis protein